MRNIATKTDNVDTLSAAEFNGSIMMELESSVTFAGITLDTSTDTDTEMLAQALTRNAQGAASYQDGGTANTYVLTALGGFKQPSAYTDGMSVIFKAGNASTGASTINVAGVGVKALVDTTGSALVADSVVADTYYSAIYSSGSDNFELVSYGGGGASGDAEPIGKVSSFAMATVPTGWLECDGSSLNTITYAALFAAVGYVHGGSGSSFNLPDLRGEFVRGWDNGRGIDAGRAFGSFQDFAMEDWSATFSTRQNDAVQNTSGIASSATAGSGAANGSTGSDITLDPSATLNTAAETRPRNVALIYCIKYAKISGGIDPVVVGGIDAESSTVGQVITSDGAGNSIWGDKEQFLHVQDQKANGTDGGTATSGSYQTRDLNTVETNEIAGASLAANRITLAAGTYYVEWSAPAHADGAVTSRHKTRLSNISGAAVSIIGTSEFVESSGSEPVTTRSFGAGRFTIAGSTVLELQHRVEVTNSADGFGQSVSFGDIEVYSDIKIWRIL